MAHHGIQEYGDMGGEEYPDEFQCCVCLDIMYKPVVLACGHISCFWCVFKAMDTFQESHCPVCRNPYNHFPRICNLLHNLLLKLYPSAYKRKERQVAEEEKEYGHESPQCDGNLIDSRFIEELDIRDSSSLLGAARVDSNATCGGDHTVVQDSLKNTFPGEVNSTTIPTTSSSHTITDKEKCVVEHTNQLPVTDLQCVVCKDLLYRPVVLNCGHVFCEACIDPHVSVCKCPLCQSAHPNGFPSVCLVLEHFLEERFPEEYSARKESLRNCWSASPSGAEKQEPAQCSLMPSNSDYGTKFHPGVGCDYCGMYPIIGLRYKCKDCVEKIGFDLCEGCYNSSSKQQHSRTPVCGHGRFNQQHTQEHQFDVVQSSYLRNIILSLGAEHLEEYDFIATNPNSPDEVLTVTDLPVGTLENELASLNSSDDYSQDLEDAMTSTNSSNNRSDDQDRESDAHNPLWDM